MVYLLLVALLTMPMAVQLKAAEPPVASPAASPLEEGSLEPALEVGEVGPEDGLKVSTQPGLAQPVVPIALADESDEPDSGNWYEKLKWWKEAKWTYTVDIQAAMEALEALGQTYETRKETILAQLADYSAALPVKRQIAEKEIDDLIEDMVRRQNEIAKEEPKKRDESQSDELELQKKMLSELKEKFGQFNTLAKRIKQAFAEIVPKQLADAKAYDEKALNAYQSIEKILDDKKAEELYNEVENSLENIKAITNYLRNPLNAFLDRAWAKTQEIMPQITTGIQDLEEQGVAVRPLAPEEEGQMAAIEKQRVELIAQQKAEAEAARKRAARPWYEKLFDAIGSFVSTVWSGITAPFKWLGGLFATKTPEKLIKKTVEAKSVKKPAEAKPAEAPTKKVPTTEPPQTNKK